MKDCRDLSHPEYWSGDEATANSEQPESLLNPDATIVYFLRKQLLFHKIIMHSQHSNKLDGKKLR
jgi:hypothetical protein